MGCAGREVWGGFAEFVEFPYRSECRGPITTEEIPFSRGFVCSLASRDEIRIKCDLWFGPGLL
ncbi:MAG TPA: hypothetical protein DCR20_04065 [Planctomycetaceae bacterium]|nr:hypothetical protein [Planctomycetaceae bacterium]